MTQPMLIHDIAIEKSPGGPGAGFRWRIRRAGGDKPLNLVLISSDWFGIRTHYYLNRTRPHLSHDCPACAAGLSRWSGYLFALDYSDESKILWEFTPAIHDDLAKLREECGTLRGQKVQITRAGKRANGRLQLARRGAYSQLATLPPEEPILPALFHIWGLPLPKDSAAQDIASPAGVTEADIAPTKTKRKRRTDETADLERGQDDLPGQLRFVG